MNGFLSSLKRHAPLFLSCISAIGTVVTAVLVAIETPKALERLEVAENEKQEGLTPLETLQVVAPVYIPAISVGASTLLCIFGSHALNARRQASLVGAYALLESTYREYKDKVVGVWGEEANRIVETAIEEEQAAEGEDRPAFDEIQTFYEENYGKFFESTMRAVYEAQYHINRNLSLKGRVTLNEFYDFLGIDHIKEGDRLGWGLDDGVEFYGYSWIDFDHRYFKTDDGLTVCAIEMPFAPHPPEEDL